ncbi:hypothetical protein BG004_007391 [Podila humilis]|nr:hypothetical protein BG004_007391 [Podila humilis]
MLSTRLLTATRPSNASFILPRRQLPTFSSHGSLKQRLRLRSLWTVATDSHPDLTTSLARCLPHPPLSSSSSSVTIILASRSYPGSDLLDLPSKLPSHLQIALSSSSTPSSSWSSSRTTVIGAVVDRVPTSSGHGVSTLSYTTKPDDQKIQFIEPFYLSGSESRRKRLKEKSVGKWARAQDIEERSLDTADAWNAFKSISIGRNQVQVPEAILSSDAASSSSLPSTRGQEQKQQQQPEQQEQTVLMLSDLEVHQFLEALDVAVPEATKIGLVASSTPFITGKPVTMFYGNKVVQDGVVGVSIVKSKKHIKHGGDTKEATATTTAAETDMDTATVTVEYPSMSTLGSAMQITRCRGNIILELDESNATRLLLDRLQATTLTKDKEYFLATGEPTVLGSLDHKDETTDIDMTKATVYKITGGDPSKGNMAVDTEEYNPSLVDKEAPVRNVFGGSSENGFIVGNPNEDTWVCAVTDSVLNYQQ